MQVQKIMPQTTHYVSKKVVKNPPKMQNHIVNTPVAHKMPKKAIKSLAIATAVLGLVIASCENKIKNQAPTTIEKDFNSEKSLKEQGLTRHWCAAKNGPNKGSKYYSSEDYDFFGNYKK